MRSGSRKHWDALLLIAYAMALSVEASSRWTKRKTASWTLARCSGGTTTIDVHRALVGSIGPAVAGTLTMAPPLRRPRGMTRIEGAIEDLRQKTQGLAQLSDEVQRLRQAHAAIAAPSPAAPPNPVGPVLTGLVDEVRSLRLAFEREHVGANVAPEPAPKPLATVEIWESPAGPIDLDEGELRATLEKYRIAEGPRRDAIEAEFGGEPCVALSALAKGEIYRDYARAYRPREVSRKRPAAASARARKRPACAAPAEASAPVRRASPSALRGSKGFTWAQKFFPKHVEWGCAEPELRLADGAGSYCKKRRVREGYSGVTAVARIADVVSLYRARG